MSSGPARHARGRPSGKRTKLGLRRAPPYIEHFHRFARSRTRGPGLVLDDEIFDPPAVPMTAAVAVHADGRDLAMVLERGERHRVHDTFNFNPLHTLPRRRTWPIVNARQGEFTLFSACPYGRITVLPHDNKWRNTHCTL